MTLNTTQVQLCLFISLCRCTGGDCQQAWSTGASAHLWCPALVLPSPAPGGGTLWLWASVCKDSLHFLQPLVSTSVPYEIIQVELVFRLAACVGEICVLCALTAPLHRHCRTLHRHCTDIAGSSHMQGNAPDQVICKVTQTVSQHTFWW